MDVTDAAILDMAGVQDLQDDDDDVFVPPKTPSAPYHTFVVDPNTRTESHLDVDTDAISVVGALGDSGIAEEQPRLIVEALVVRKMSLEEAFLDFGGFSLT